MKRLVAHLRNYIEIYLALGVSVAATLIGVLPSSSSEETLNKLNLAVSVISGALVLNGVIALRERTRSEKDASILGRLENRTALLAMRSDIVQQRNSIFDKAQHEIYILLRYGDTLTYETERLKRALDRGVKIYYICCSPSDDNLMELLALRADRAMPSHADPKQTKLIIERMIQSFKNIADHYNDEARTVFDIRTMKYIPPFILFMSDPQLGSGEALVTIANFRKAFDHAPSIMLRKCDSEELFLSFFNEFMQYWTTPEIQG